MRRQARRKLTPVSSTDLGFRSKMTVSEDVWQEYSLTERDVAIAHFESRQMKRNYPPEIVPIGLQRGIEWKCVLNDSVGGTHNNMPLPDLEDCLRTRTISKAKVYQVNQKRPLSNPFIFWNELNALKRMLKVHPPKWFWNTIQMQLGPKQIHLILEGKLKHIHARRNELLTYNHHSSAILFVDARQESERQKREIQECLDENTTPEKFFLAAPSSGFAMSIEYGKEPTFISEPGQSHHAMFYENELIQKAKSHYEKVLQCPIRNTKLLSETEKTWLEKISGIADIVSNRVRIIEFESLEDRNRHAKDLGAFDILYCETMYNYQETYEDVFLTIEYDTRPKYVEGVKVYLTYEADKSFAEEAFKDHGLAVVYFDKNDVRNHDAKYDPNVMSLVIQYFPKHHRTLEDRAWFIRQVCESNFISIEGTEKHIEYCSLAKETAREARRLNVKTVIDYEIYKLAHNTHIYRPIDADWDSVNEAVRGARHFAGVVMERPDVPWSVVRTTTERQHESREDHYQVFFQDAQTGCRLINAILETYYREPIFRCDLSDQNGPKLHPVFRIRTPISRSMRAAFHYRITSLDSQLRHTFPDYSATRDRLMCLNESQFFAARIFELWSPKEDAGFIGVEGWNEQAVRHFFANLQRILRPVEFRATEQYQELLYGIGEAYVRNVAESNKVHVDIDKFRQTISVFGDRARDVVAQLNTFPTMKDSIQVETDIPLFFPFSNTTLRKQLNDRSLSQLFINLSARCRCEFDDENQCIKFTGTLESYEFMTRAIAELSSEVFRRYVAVREEEIFLQCPVCISETGLTGDVFRFHCGHVMCRACVNLMVQSRINEPQVRIQCAVEGCEKFLTPMEIKTIILGDSRRIRELDGIKLMRLTARAKQSLINNSNETIKPCPTADCVGIFYKSPGDPEDAKRCATCHRPYCRSCLSGVHSGETCEDHALLEVPDASIAAFVKKTGRNNVKMCPNCNIWVIKSEGCNHIECKCGSHFCWVCLYLAKDYRDCYEHMGNEHRGFGGDWHIENNRIVQGPDDDDLDLDMQRLMLGEHDLPHQQPLPALNNVNIQRDELFVENRQMGQLMTIDRLVRATVAPNFLVEPGNQLEEFRPINRFPEVVMTAFPQFYGDVRVQQMILEWLNNSASAPEFHWKVRQLFAWPRNV